MRAQISRAVAALFAGRTRKAAFAEIAAAFTLAAILWVAACVFVTLEPTPIAQTEREGLHHG